MARVIGTLAAAGDTQAPTQPQNLQATAINRQRVDLTWTASTDNVGVAGYQVFRNGSPLDVASGTTFSDTTAQASTTYTYVVVAFDAAGNNSVPSASDDATTPANASPSWQTIPDQTLIVGDSYTLNLNNFCSDADADTIQYSITAGTLPSGISRSGAIISGTPTTAGQTPTITVRAFDGFVNVDTTIAYATFTADVTAPPVPTGLSATAASSSNINLSWSASTDAAGTSNEFVSGTQDYRVYRSTDQSNFSLRTTVAATNYSDTGLSASTRYDYKVTARDVELNESAQSSAVNATTASASSLEADWQVRISGTGVVWFHDFRSDAEVNNFRWSSGQGVDPTGVGALAGNVRRITTDGMASGACLEVIRGGAGQQSSEPPVWWRPFSPMQAPGNGRATSDPGNGGAITPKVWDPNNRNSLDLHDNGWYGHSSYASADPVHFDGTDFYLQVVCKMDPRRITGGNEANTTGKFIWLSTAFGEDSLSNAEHVFMSYGPGGNDGAKNYLRAYSLGVNGIGAFDPLDQEEPGPRIQPGSDSATDWSYSGGWDTLLFHLRLGQQNVTSGANATRLEIWAAHEGETSYTKVWDQEYGNSAFQARNGLQALLLAAYNNGNSFPQQFYHRYAQVIFSKQTIPCPQVYPTSAPLWFQNQTTSTWLALNTRMSDLGAAVDDGMFAYSGMVASSSTLMHFAQGGHADSANNGGFVLNLMAESPAWAQVVAKSSSVQIDVPYYADGKPTSRHGYGQQVFIPAGITNGNRWFTHCTTHAWGTGNYQSGIAASYSFDSGAYDAQGFWPNNWPETAEDSAAAWDSATGLVWIKESWIFGSGGGIRSFNPATKTYSAHLSARTTSGSSAGYGVAIDPIRRIFLILQTGNLHAYDLADTAHAPYLNIPKSASLTTDGAPGLEYDPINQCFYAWSGGQTIYKIVPNASNWRTGQWTVTTMTIAGGSATPTAAYPNGTYGKFRYISDLHALVVVNRFNQTPYVFKLP